MAEFTVGKFVEIERAFHVKNEDWRKQVSGAPIVMRAVYLSRDPKRVIRLRWEDGNSILTIKGKSDGPERPEFNIPVDADAATGIFANPALWDGTPIVKVRWPVSVLGQNFVVDVFDTPRRGYQRAEIEMRHRNTALTLPAWVGEEITEKFEHSNSAIAGESPSRWNISEFIEYYD